MIVSRGDVVMVDFPYSDRTGSKLRPAVVVQADRWNRTLADTILAPVTSSARRQVNAESQLLIQIADPESISTGLRMDSVVQCENLVTYYQAMIIRKLGTVSAEHLRLIDACLKSVFDLR